MTAKIAQEVFSVEKVEQQIAQLKRIPVSRQHAISMLLNDYRNKVAELLEEENPSIDEYVQLKRVIAHLITL